MILPSFVFELVKQGALLSADVELQVEARRAARNLCITRGDLQAMFLALRRRTKTAALLVTHDLHEAELLADRRAKGPVKKKATKKKATKKAGKKKAAKKKA